ncbi:MAG: ABC transporter ATP-binding protein [bacterium]
MEIIELRDIKKIYQLEKHKIEVLQDINLKIENGDFITIMGPSGSGKSTLLNIIGCLDRLSSGFYFLESSDISKLNDDTLSEIRNKKIGFVFQTFNLLPRLSALENVLLPFLYNPKSNFKEAKERAINALSEVGLDRRINHKPGELSGGEAQRVAIARAIVNNPLIILADEPTGNLDSKTAEDIMEVFSKLNKEGKTILLVTHNNQIAQSARRRFYIKDGIIIEAD